MHEYTSERRQQAERIQGLGTTLGRSVAIVRETRNGVRPMSGAKNEAPAMAFGGPRSSCVRPGAHSAQHQDSRNDWTPCRMAGPFVSAGAHTPHPDETLGPTPSRGSSHSARRLRPLAFLCSPAEWSAWPRGSAAAPRQASAPPHRPAGADVPGRATALYRTTDQARLRSWLPGRAHLSTPLRATGRNRMPIVAMASLFLCLLSAVVHATIFPNPIGPPFRAPQSISNPIRCHTGSFSVAEMKSSHHGRP